MDKNKQYKIALVLYTQGLDYDDRIRKEILSIQTMFDNVKFKIFAVEPKNREEEGVTSYGVPYRIPYLKSREKYPKASHALSKTMDFYKSIKKDLKEFDILWCADVETFPFVLLTKGMPILWDHHELPDYFMKKTLLKLVYKRMERKCKVVIHANKPRLDYMNELGLVSNTNKHFVLRNYPDFNEIDTEYDDTYDRFVQWLGDSKCVYLQGLMGEKRADVESIGAVLAIPELKAVVVGKISDARKQVFENKFGKKLLEERVFFTGQQKQLKTPQYIRKCITCLVFYKNSNMNNWYCEPNRLFQNLINGNPVVVGNNPPMKELVEKNGFGVVVDTDGGDVDKIIQGLNELIHNYSYYKENVDKNKSLLIWPSQNDEIKKIIELLLSN